MVRPWVLTGDQLAVNCHVGRPRGSLDFPGIVRWSRLGVFARIFAALATKGGASARMMIEATHLKAHWTAASLLPKGSSPHRTHQGRVEFQAARRLRRPGPARRSAAHRGPGQRPRRCHLAAADAAASTRTAGRLRLRQQLVSGRTGNPGGSRPASRRCAHARCHCTMTGRYTASVIASKTPVAG